MGASVECKACGETGPGRALVHLWDGELYCQACVESACPGLAEYAASHDQLEETEPRARPREVLKDLVCFWLWYLLLAPALVGTAFVLLFGVSAMGEWLRLYPESLVAALIVWGALMFPVPVWKAWIDLRGTHNRVIAVRDGLVTVRKVGGRLLCELPLVACRWYVATLMEAAQQELWLRLRADRDQPLVFLVLPIRILGITVWRRRVPCGFTPVWRQRWQAFLTLTNTSKGRPSWLVRLTSGSGPRRPPVN